MKTALRWWFGWVKRGGKGFYGITAIGLWWVKVRRLYNVYIRVTYRDTCV